MATPKQNRRRELFQLYSANFAMFVSKYSGFCACPICGRPYNEQAIEAASLQLDLAHIYPQACGRSPETLTCKRCNSRMGAEYDSHIARDYQLVDAFDGTGRGAVGARLRFPSGHSMGVEIQRRGDCFSFKGIGKQTNPVDEQKIVENILATGKVSFQMDMKVPDNERHLVALLHSAYLACFRYFGYEYVFFGNSGWIRDILNGQRPAQDLDCISMEIPEGHLDMPIETVLFEPVVARTADGINCLGVALPIPKPGFATRVILLPGFGEEAANSFCKLREAWIGNHHHLRIAAENLDPVKRLSDRRYLGYGHQWWNHLCGALAHDA